MTTHLETRIASLLLKTSEAHQKYRKFALQGKSDPDWTNWYALYIVEHDFAQVINQTWTCGQISRFLDRSFSLYETSSMVETNHLSWIEFTTHKLLEALFPEAICPEAIEPTSIKSLVSQIPSSSTRLSTSGSPVLAQVS